jgi:hypothetical protein
MREFIGDVSFDCSLGLAFTLVDVHFPGQDKAVGARSLISSSGPFGWGTPVANTGPGFKP